MSRIQAVAFDFDDTLSDWPAAVERAATLLEEEVPFAKQLGFAGRFLQIAGRLYPSRNPGPLFFEAEAVIALALGGAGDGHALAERFRSLVQPIPFPDVAPTITELSARLRLAVLSNNPYAPEGLRVLGLAGHFATVIALREDSGLAKPHRHAFDSLVRSLGLEAPEVLYVGDSITHDVEGAQAAGLAAVWLDRFGSPAAVPPRALRITSLTEVPGLLERL